MNAWNSVCIFLGVIALAFAILSYEDEEKSANSWIERAWVYLSDVEVTLSSRLLKVLKSVIERCEAIISNVFGSRLLSLRTIYSSIGLSGLYTLMEHWYDAVAIALIFFAAYRFNFVKHLLLASVFYLIATIFLGGILFQYIPDYQMWGVLVFLAKDAKALPLVALAVDIAALVSVRRLSRAAIRSKRLRNAILFAVCGGLVVPSTLVILGTFFEREQRIVLQILCAPAVLASSLFLMLVISLALYRLVAACLPRFAYSFIKFKIIENRKSMACIGVSLIAVGSPSGASTVEKLLKIFTG